MKKIKLDNNDHVVFAGTGKGIFCYRTAADRGQAVIAAALVGVMSGGDVSPTISKLFETMTGHCSFHCAAFEMVGTHVWCNAIGADIGELEQEA